MRKLIGKSTMSLDVDYNSWFYHLRDLMFIRRKHYPILVIICLCFSFCFAINSAKADPYKAKVQEALKQLDEQLKQSPDDAKKLLARAALRAYEEDHVGALADLNRVITLDPKNLDAYEVRSSENLALKKNDEALADASAAIKLDTEHRAKCFIQRAICYYILAKDEAAALDLDEVLDRCPTATNAEKEVCYSDRAEIFCRLGKYKQALDDCTKTIELDPRGCGGAAYYWRGVAMAALKDPGADAAKKQAAEIGYVDTGREVTAVNNSFYPQMFDPVQSQFIRRIDTRHFVFFFNTDESEARSIAKFAECFLAHVDKDICKTDWNNPVNVYMLPNKEAQYTFLKQHMKVDQNVWGTMVPSRNALVFYTTSGFGTVAHIIFSKISSETFRADDQFSGIQAFFEKVYGYEDPSAGSAIYWGYQNPWRLKLIAQDLPNLTLSQVIQLSSDTATDHQSVQRLVAMFLYDNQKFKKYINLAIAGDRKGYGTLLEAAFDMSIEKLEPIWHQYLQDISTNLATLEEIPNSEFLTSKNEFDSFIEKNPKYFKDLSQHLSSRPEKGSDEAKHVDDAATEQKAGVLPKGWIRAGSHPEEYEMGMDDKVLHSGTTSGAIKSIATKLGGFGTLMQMFSADKYRGKRVRLTCWTKTADVTGWAGMWMRVDGPDGQKNHLAFDNMQDRPIKGTTDWKMQEIVLDVPNESVNIAFGVLLDGAGKVWTDDFKLEPVGNDVPTTADATSSKKEKPSYINDSAVNMDFEDGR